MAHIKASVVAQDTGTDIFLPSFHQFGHPCLISEEPPGESRAVDPAFCDCLCRCKRIHPPGAYNRNIHKLPDMLHIQKITILRHIDWRMRPIPGIVCSIIAIEHIVACILKILHRLFGFRHIPSCLLIVLSRQRAFPESLCHRADAVP